MSAPAAAAVGGALGRVGACRRRSNLAAVLLSTGYVTIDDARRVGARGNGACSEATLRRDLAWLAKRLGARRVHGGVVLHPLTGAVHRAR